MKCILNTKTSLRLLSLVCTKYPNSSELSSLNDYMDAKFFRNLEKCIIFNVKY